MNYANEYIENLMLDVDHAIQQNNPKEAKNLLEEVLSVEPDYSVAHNHLGWLYMYFLKNYSLAESHLRLAIKFQPPYPVAFQHLGALLLWEGRLAESERILKKSLDYQEVNKSVVYEDLGKIYELRGKFILARKQYKNAVRNSLDNEYILHLRKNIKRCRMKFLMF